MSNEHEAPAKPSKPLVGRGNLTEEEKSAFLAQARASEEGYRQDLEATGKSEIRRQAVFVAESGLENSFYPKAPEVLVEDIRANMFAIKENAKLLMNPPSDSLDPNYERDRKWLSEKIAEGRENITDSLTRLKASYEDPDPIRGAKGRLSKDQIQQIIFDTQKDIKLFDEQWLNLWQKVDADFSRTAWHKKWSDPNTPLQFTESLKHASRQAGVDGDKAPLPDFKPYAGDPLRGADALYTSAGEATSKASWHTKVDASTYQFPISEQHLKAASKYTIAAMGLMSVAKVVDAHEGTLTEKFNASKQILQETVIDAVPGVTYMQKMLAGQYEEARLDAASYLPFGDITALARSPEAQAVIDALPNNAPALQKMLSDKAEAPINRHLAEYQLRLMNAKDNGDALKGWDAMTRLTELAEQKIILQGQWSKNSADFVAAIQNPEADLKQVVKSNPQIAAQVNLHMAAINSGHSQLFADRVDVNLADSLAKGRLPILPEIPALDKQTTQHAGAVQNMNVQQDYCM